MIESFYNLLAMFGFHHPIHPIVVHAPMGLVIGAVAFALASFVWTNKHFEQSAYHCALLALISIVPVYIAGLLDWQYVFAGDWSKWVVIKMILGIVLLAGEGLRLAGGGALELRQRRFGLGFCLGLRLTPGQRARTRGESQPG